MKAIIGVLMCLLGVQLAYADVTITFSAPYIGGIPFNFADSSGTPTNGMRWGIIVDTAGNGFANNSVNYDAYAPGVTTAGFLSVGGVATDDYYIPGTTTVEGSTTNYTDANSVTPGTGSILGSISSSLVSPLAAQQSFALVWFSNNKSENGSKYGFLSDSTFKLPADGSDLKSYDDFFINNDPVRTASLTFGVPLSNPKIAVFDGNGTGGSARTDNVGTSTFANSVSGSPGGTQVFTLQNTGGQTLNSISITKATGGYPVDFIVNTNGTATSLAANATTTFSVTFSPSAVGTRTATVQIGSNDTTQNPFRINLSGIGTATAGPSIAVYDGVGTTGNSRASGSSAFTFPSIQVNLSDPVQTFTVKNNGTADLTGLTASVLTADSNDFDVVSSSFPNTLIANATTSFTVGFHPRTAGTRTAVVTLSGSGGSPSFVVNLSGYGAASSGTRIQVLRGTSAGTELFNGAATIAYPTTVIGSSSAAQTFTIQNIGVADLTNIIVSLGGTGSPDFLLDATQTPTSLMPGQSCSFTVTFKPATEGLRTAAIQIGSNDASDNPFVIALTGKTHALSFDLASQTRKEATETITVPVHLSSNYASAFSVPVTFSGSVVPAFTHTPAAVLNFLANQTSPVAQVTLSLKDDLVAQLQDKVITVTLGSPSDSGVVLGDNPQFKLTIVDNDTPPTITPPPADKIVTVGGVVGWQSGATGSDPMTYQWKKNNAIIAGDNAKTGSLNLTSSATVADAGLYSLTATNNRSTVTKSALLDVVDNGPGMVKCDVGGTATLSATTAGTGMTYQWYRKTLANPRTPINNLTISGVTYSNATTKTLTIKKVAASNAGIYFCSVTGPVGAGSVDSGLITLQVPTAAPTSESFTFPDCVAFNSYPAFQIPSNELDGNLNTLVPTKYTCVGLPTGLVCNPATGVVTGKPTKVGLNQIVTVTLTNAQGHVSIATSINIIPFSAAGVCVGLVDRHAATNGNIGGRLDLSVTASGTYTGALKLGGTSYSLTGSFTTGSTPHAHPSATIVIHRTGTPLPAPLTLTLDLNPDNDQVLGTVSVQGDASVANIVGWRNVWHTTLPNANPVTANQFGFHSFKLKLDSASSALSGIPQGYGYGTVDVTLAGVTTVVGRTSDGGVIASSKGVLSADGKVIVYQPLYMNHGSISGSLMITADSNHTIASHLDWEKLTITAGYGRDYAAFNLIGVDATGGRYISSAPVAGFAVTAAGTNNAQLLFTDGGIGSALNPDVSLRISDKNVSTFPPKGSNNLGGITSLSLTPATGAFSGKFTLSDSATVRSASSIPFQGQIVTTEGKGLGFFLLPQLASPPTKPSTTPVLSGAVMLQQ